LPKALHAGAVWAARLNEIDSELDEAAADVDLFGDSPTSWNSTSRPNLFDLRRLAPSRISRQPTARRWLPRDRDGPRTDSARSICVPALRRRYRPTLRISTIARLVPVAQRDPRLAHQRSGEVIENLVHLAPAGQGLHVFEPALKLGIGFVTRADQETDVDDLCCEVVGDADPVAAQIGTLSERVVVEDAEGPAGLRSTSAS
jgi:hypothetical protein